MVADAVVGCCPLLVIVVAGCGRRLFDIAVDVVVGGRSWCRLIVAAVGRCCTPSMLVVAAVDVDRGRGALLLSAVVVMVVVFTAVIAAVVVLSLLLLQSLCVTAACCVLGSVRGRCLSD